MKQEDFIWLTELSLKFLGRDYLLPGQTFIDRMSIIINRFKELHKNDEECDLFLHYLQQGYYSLSTPIWTNYATDRGLPISCFGSYISDSMESILYTVGEIGMMSKYGGGTSAFMDVRKRGAGIKNNGSSAGPYGFESLYDRLSTVVSQGSTRRGSLAMYMDVSHPDIMEHLAIRDEGNAIQDLSFGVCVSDDWMNSMLEGDQAKRDIWARVLEVRFNTGYPYIFFTDNANKFTVDVYKDKKMKIHASNLCTEIMLPSNDLESFICCLASMNALKFDQWKDTRAVEMLVYFLDTVLEDFILKLQAKIEAKGVFPTFMDRALRFAERHRALGIGVLGLASYYQSKMIPFDSMEAKMYNSTIFKTIKTQAYKASEALAQRFGEPEVLKGYGRRNTTLMAVAPTKSSSFILGQEVSEGIEPWRTNLYIKDLAKMKYIVRNPFLVQLLASKGKDTQDVWDNIAKDSGSVQNIDFLSDYEKRVFATMEEIAPRELVIQAATRQKFIDQGQSLNLMIHPKTPVKEVNALIIEGWKLGLKSFYYQHSVNAAQEFAREFMNCSSCEA